MKEYLPIGSVVTLKQGTKKVVICGRIQKETKQGQIYDYCACLYPEGMIDSRSVYLFDQEDIGRIYYVGMQDEEEFAFRVRLEEELKKLSQVM